VAEEVKAMVLPEELEAAVVAAMAVCLMLQMEVQEQPTLEGAVVVEAATATLALMAVMAVLVLLSSDTNFDRRLIWDILLKY
jgi:tetrahydromethanopterin S-methyltransferase subunit E